MDCTVRGFLVLMPAHRHRQDQPELVCELEYWSTGGLKHPKHSLLRACKHLIHMRFCSHLIHAVPVSLSCSAYEMTSHMQGPNRLVPSLQENGSAT